MHICSANFILIFYAFLTNFVDRNLFKNQKKQICYSFYKKSFLAIFFVLYVRVEYTALRLNSHKFCTHFIASNEKKREIIIKNMPNSIESNSYLKTKLFINHIVWHWRRQKSTNTN